MTNLHRSIRSACVLLLVMGMSACATDGTRQSAGAPTPYPPPGYSHTVQSSHVALYWNCTRPDPAVVQVSGLAFNPWSDQPIRYLELELVGVDPRERSVSAGSGGRARHPAFHPSVYAIPAGPSNDGHRGPARSVLPIQVPGRRTRRSADVEPGVGWSRPVCATTDAIPGMGRMLGNPPPGSLAPLRGRISRLGLRQGGALPRSACGGPAPRFALWGRFDRPCTRQGASVVARESRWRFREG